MSLGVYMSICSICVSLLSLSMVDKSFSFINKIHAWTNYLTSFLSLSLYLDSSFLDCKKLFLLSENKAIDQLIVDSQWLNQEAATKMNGYDQNNDDGNTIDLTLKLGLPNSDNENQHLNSHEVILCPMHSLIMCLDNMIYY